MREVARARECGEAGGGEESGDEEGEGDDDDDDVEGVAKEGSGDEGVVLRGVELGEEEEREWETQRRWGGERSKSEPEPREESGRWWERERRQEEENWARARGSDGGGGVRACDLRKRERRRVGGLASAGNGFSVDFVELISFCE